MYKETNHFASHESPFDALCKEKESQGWQYVSREGLTQTKFSKDAKFEEIPYQTEEEIRARYIQEARAKNPTLNFEVDLVLDQNTEKLKKLKSLISPEEYAALLERLNPEDKNYLVFMRQVEHATPEVQKLTFAEIANRLEVLQQNENNGRGVSCVKEVIVWLRRGDFEKAKLMATHDHDKIANYPEIERIMETYGLCESYETFRERFNKEK